MSESKGKLKYHAERIQSGEDMERVSDANVRYVMEELERLKVEIQRLEAMLVPIVRGELSKEELGEIEREARDFKEEDWIDADELERILCGSTLWA